MKKMVNSETVWEGKSKSKSFSVSVFGFVRNQKIYFEKRHSWHRMCLFVFLSYLHNSHCVTFLSFGSFFRTTSFEWMLTFSWFTASFLLKWNQFCESKCCTYILLAEPCYFKSVCSLFSDIRNGDKIVSLFYLKN